MRMKAGTGKTNGKRFIILVKFLTWLQQRMKQQGGNVPGERQTYPPRSSAAAAGRAKGHHEVLSAGTAPSLSRHLPTSLRQRPLPAGWLGIVLTES